MSKKIDWLYKRKSCTTCKKADGYMTAAGTAVGETVDATKTRYGPADALKLLAGIDTVVAAKGKKIDVLDLKGDRPTDDEILAHLIGPTGNLRAPTARVGTTLLVGFSPEAYQQVLGA